MAITTNHRVLLTLPTVEVNKKSCTATVAMVIIKDDIYCVRTYDGEGEKQPVVLHKLCNYLSGGSVSSSYVIVHTPSNVTNIAKHANSLTYHDHVFYLVTMNGKTENQVMAFGSDGIITNRYKYNGGIIATINYYDTKNGALRFLVAIKKTDSCEDVEHRLVKISGSQLVDVGISFTALVSNSTYLRGNDSYYNRSTKQLYLTKFKTVSEGEEITNNWVLQYDLSDGISGTGGQYFSVRTLRVKNTSEERKLEIEGISMYDNKKFVCVNSTDSNKKQTDTVCQLYLP